MCRFIDSIRSCAVILWLAVLAVLSATPLAAEPQRYAGLGRSATAVEIQAWDIDVRADFKGLPAGSGSVAKGQQLWEAKCESCHGVFGELTTVFTPIAGGTTAGDMQSGHTANLRRTDYPQRTTLMKLPNVSTLWDYIRRAMPWNAPKSLSDDEVYALTAYVLNLGDIVPADFVLSAANIRDVQNRLPNRNGMLPFAPMAMARADGDVRNTRCMKNCPLQMTQMSLLPDYARNQHGNLAEQNRLVGATRGVDTSLQAGSQAAASTPLASANSNQPSPLELAQKYACNACHRTEGKLVGPSYTEIAARYKGNTMAEALLVAKVKSGGTGVWGNNVMPSHADIDEADLRALVRWSLSGGN